MHMVYKLRKFECECHEQLEKLHWDYEPMPCPVCGKEMHEVSRFNKFGTSAFVHGDEIDVEIRHGVCNPDGSPRRFRSKEELKRAAFDANLTFGGETPHINQKVEEARKEKHERMWAGND